MSDLIQLDNLSLDTLTELAKESFADCQDALQVYLDNEKKLKRFGDILRACREKVPHGQWQQWVLETFAGHLSIRAVQLWIAEAQEPEKRQKRLEHDREQKQKAKGPKAQDLALLPEQPPPAPPAPVPPSQPRRPAWLADPDELDRPEEDDLPPLPRTNTHYTTDNRRTPDGRETDRAGLVSPDDPRELQDGAWYAWSEARNRLLPVTDGEILRRADLLRSQSIVEPAKDTSPVVDHKTASVSSKPGKVPTLSQLRAAVDAKAEWSDMLRESVRDWAAYKMTLAGKDKIRSMESWQKALTRMANVARERDVATVCEAIEKAIANGWTGWEHLETSGSRGGSRISTAVRSNRNWDEEIPEWKPTE